MIEYNPWLLKLQPLLQAAITPGSFTGQSGKQLNGFLDCKPVLLSTNGLRYAAYAFRSATFQMELDLVAGPGAGGLLFVGGILACAPGLRGAGIYPAVKDHGKGGRIMGQVQSGDRVCLVDDVCTTGNSLRDAAQVLTEAGAKVLKAVVLVDRSGGETVETVKVEGEPDKQVLKGTGIVFHSLFRWEDFQVPTIPLVED